MKTTLLPKKQGLYNPDFEHDSCGVGFIANIKGNKSHNIIRRGIQILNNMEHRGAVGCDPLTGDGAGILIQMPDDFLRSKCAEIDIELPELGEYGTGLIFLPHIMEDRNKIENWFEHIVREEGQVFLGWRDVPYDNSHIGKIARASQPLFKQAFIQRGRNTKPENFEKKLFVIRKRIGLAVMNSTLNYKNFFYICSLTTKTLIYKGQLMATQLDRFFPDLTDENMVTAIALVHSRYSTNTFPTWALAHPFRMVAHNGEINTLRGNKNWMHAREKQFKGDIFGEDVHKIMPVIAAHKSDSASFDNALEMLVMSGRDLPHAVMMMIPEAWSAHKSMKQERKDFYEYHSCLMEPWDGPASIAFTDGRYIGAVLDRNGLRPSRYWVTKDDYVIMASETGVLDIPAENILLKDRLRPGRIFLVDTQEGRIIKDEEIKDKYAARRPYSQWLKENMVDISDLPEMKTEEEDNSVSLIEKQKTFGYTLEDFKILLSPMAVDGKEALGSMGADTPLAVLSRKPQPLFNYFKQLFAQVTNPPIDPIREEIVMSENVLLGKEGNLLSETAEHCRRLKLPHPVLSNKELQKFKNLKLEGLKARTLDMTFKKKHGKGGLKKALKKLFALADDAIKDGVSIIILSDKKTDADNVPMPSLLACSGLHHHLIREGTRTKTSIVLETGEAREMHHFAVLIGYGANAINPYLAFETIKNEIEKGFLENGIAYEKAEKNYIKSTRAGLFKIISKMGISTIQSYCGAQIFEAVGLSEKFVEKYFTSTPTRIGGIGIETIAEEMLMNHSEAFPDEKPFDDELKTGGFYQWRRDGEHHQINPQTIALLQQAVRTGDYKKFKEYTNFINQQSTNLASIRGLLEFNRKKPIPIEEVEPASEIVKRFATGAMSYGSISKEAHETLAVAMNRLGGFSNTGEGGEDPARFKKEPNGDWKRSRIKQIAQGRFGVTIEYLNNADQLQIKMAQGAKPGEGGQLPGHKVSKEIAKTRYTTPGVGLISPPPHHDIYSIEDLSQLIFDLKNSNPNAEISVKLVSEMGVGTVAAGVAKGKADHILISGYEGGTGASPLTSIKHCGLPMELGISEAQQVLVLNGLRRRVRLQADGQLKTGRDVVITAMLGADEFGFSTAALISMGCIMLRKCHQNTCSVGVATQDPELRKHFAGKPEHVINFFSFIAEEVREYMAELGFAKFDDLIGRVDLLEVREIEDHWKAKGLDLSTILHRPDVPAKTPLRHAELQEHSVLHILDRRLIESSKKALDDGKMVSFSCKINNTNRTVGTMLSSKIAKNYGQPGLPEDTIMIDFEGSAGQSFGAFLAHGVTFTLEGDANDYVGKGLSGGKVIIFPPRDAGFKAEENIIAGNVILYGATSGEMYLNGVVGERFAVRNSGAVAVVEGVGDHGCEYMTGGRVVILGPTGRNFAAGMSGGIAFVLDEDGDFETRCNTEMVELFPVEEEDDKQFINQLVENHKKYTKSNVAEKILGDFDKFISKFRKVYPIDYRRVLEEESKNVTDKTEVLI